MSTISSRRVIARQGILQNAIIILRAAKFRSLRLRKEKMEDLRTTRLPHVAAFPLFHSFPRVVKLWTFFRRLSLEVLSLNVTL